MKKVQKITCILFLLIGTFTTAFAQAETIDKDRYMLYAKYPNNIDPLSLIYELRPGESKEDAIVAANLTPNEQEFHFYATDKYITPEGVDAYKNQDEFRESSRMINLETGKDTLKAKELKRIKVTIDIPKNKPLGDYEGYIAMEKRQPSTSNPKITIAGRFLPHVKIKVTDNPQVIPPYVVPTPPSPYLIGSIILFLSTMAYYFYTNHKEKKQRHRDRQNIKNNVE